MADEQQNEPSPQESEAQKKVNVDEAVTTADPVDTDVYAKQNEAAQGVIGKYGYTSYASFLDRVGSDQLFAKSVVGDLIVGEATDTLTHPRVIAGEAFSPQEIKPDGKPRNLTGRMDHSVDTPTRVVPDAV
jgi:hypothetical protein